MLNYLQLANVCKICGKCYDKNGYRLENDDNYEVDLFICDDCKHKEE